MHASDPCIRRKHVPKVKFRVLDIPKRHSPQSGYHCPQEFSEAEDVEIWFNVLETHPIGPCRHVLTHSDVFECCSQPLVMLKRYGKPAVTEDQVAVICDEDIVWLNVSMNILRIREFADGLNNRPKCAESIDYAPFLVTDPSAWPGNRAKNMA